MTDLAERALLPAGLRDILPPLAAREAAIVEQLMAIFASHGFERVKPPLIEFEASLLGHSGTAASQTFRVMDPLTQRMMAVRSDITPQVARIAATRLVNQPRPLRLAYAGQVLRVQGSQLRAERQFGQVGAELIGATDPAAEAEILTLVTEALARVGSSAISIDLTLPTLVPLLLGERASDARLRAALDHKDVTAVTAGDGDTARLLTGLILAVGPVERGLSCLAALDLPAAAAREREQLVQVVALIRAALPALTLTIDPVENRGFEYYTGVGFTLFARDCPSEIGRGGRYLAQGEPAVGVTLFMDSLLGILPAGPTPRRLFLPEGTPRALAARLRDEGWVTIGGLAEVADLRTEALRQGCSHLLEGEFCRPLAAAQP
jgi:ATP phosphoribosyltransferase regulatory subunit